MHPLLQVEGVNKSFPQHNTLFNFLNSSSSPTSSSSYSQYKKVIDNVSFKLEQGEVLVLAGESGSGKTTLAKLIMGADSVDEGSIFFMGSNIINHLKKDKKKFHSLIQMIYQDPYSSINPYLKVKDIVIEPLKIHNDKLTESEKKAKVADALRLARLEPVDEFMDKYPTMLSGGQRQRVSIARSIVKIPKLIIADEPVSMLDISVRAEILSLLNELRKSLNISIIYITHDLATARFIGDTIGIMFTGQLVEYGNIDEILDNPLHPYTLMLLDAVKYSTPKSDYYKNNSKVDFIDTPTRGCKFYNRCNLSFMDCTSPLKKFYLNDDHEVSCFHYKNLSS